MPHLHLVSRLALVALAGASVFAAGCQKADEEEADPSAKTSSALPACDLNGICRVDPAETATPKSFSVNPHGCYSGSVPHPWAIHQATRVFRYVSSGYMKDEREGTLNSELPYMGGVTGRLNAPWNQWYWACAGGEAARQNLNARAEDFINAQKAGTCTWGSTTTATATVCTDNQPVKLAVRRLSCGNTGSGYGISYNSYDQTLTMGSKMQELQNAISACYPGSEQFFILRMRRYYSSGYRHEYYVDPDNAQLIANSSPYRSYAVDGYLNPAGGDGYGTTKVITWPSTSYIWYPSYGQNAGLGYGAFPDDNPCVTTTTYAGSESNGFMRWDGTYYNGNPKYSCW